ncbi:MAG: hypothetical protein BM556_01790 [Bacteriovorax sp. MedPE-SWde]|nr:MAG: hypothetical protein BM556_01790 [Bacteriovorax sp. MedPE-SWde]
MKCCKKNDKSVIDFNLDGLICYCFQHSKKDLYDAVKAGTEEAIINDIKSKMKDPGCFCEKSNPSGKCCMADTMAFVNHVKSQRD